MIRYRHTATVLFILAAVAFGIFSLIVLGEGTIKHAEALPWVGLMLTAIGLACWHGGV